MSAILEAVTNPEPQSAGSPSAEAAPSATQQLLKSIIESTPVSLMIVDCQGKVMAANRAALKLCGAERLAEFVGQNVWQTVAPQDRLRFSQFVAEVCAGASGSLEYDLLPLGGSTCAVETHAVPLHRDGTSPVFLGVTHDVSERRRLARALRRAEAKLEALESQRSADQVRRAPAPAARVDANQHQAMVERDAMVARLREADRQASRVEQVYERNPTEKQTSMVSRLLRRGK